MDASLSDIATSEIPFVETAHGRLRRKQRGFNKKDLQTALKHGTRQPSHPRPNGDPAAIYTFKDITYIVNERTGEEVTSYAKPLELDPVPVTPLMQRNYINAKERIQNDLNSWTSNTVIIVDVSGSMREGDMWGTRNRLGAVWVSIALDYLAERLEGGDAGESDVVSVVTLGETAEIVLHEEPSSWVLYNKLVSIYSDGDIRPRGHGMFIPSLEVAKTLLKENSCESCALSLTLLTDGIPSDHMKAKGSTKEDVRNRIVGVVRDLARTFAEDLTFTAIGIGDYESFEGLQRMVDEAKDFGSKAELKLPSMTASSLAESFSSAASSLSTIQAEMKDSGFSKQLHTRRMPPRESKSEAVEPISSLLGVEHKFQIYRRSLVKREVYTEWREGRKTKYCYDVTPLQHPAAAYVAICSHTFGRGKERYAFRFFELGYDKTTIVGKPLVAKVSRSAFEGGEGTMSRRDVVKTFCRTQQLAVRLSNEFNETLDSKRRVDAATPRVRMLECSIYNLTETNGQTRSVLVEELLDVKKWHKWNGNGGYVEGECAPNFSDQDILRDAFLNLRKVDMETFNEEDEDEEESENESESGGADGGWTTVKRNRQPIVFTASEVAHAFSHYTYWKTGRRRLVCDLQGVHDEERNEIIFSDPAIHYNNEERKDRRHIHGSTDLGKNGMARFFSTHREHHGHLCNLVLRGYRPAKNETNNYKTSAHP